MSTSRSSHPQVHHLDVPLPYTLKGPPVRSLVPPGHCQFDEIPVYVDLIARIQVSPSRWEIGSNAPITSVLRFRLPDPSQPLNLSTCACLLARAKIDGEEVVRPYTPISTNQQVGTFDLLVKWYPTGKMSTFLHEMDPGRDMIAFQHLPQNVKVQAPFQASHVGMIVGGTGINPMIQALHAILGKGDDSSNNEMKETRTKVSMLYANKVSTDILGYSILEQWQARFPEQLEVIHILSAEKPNTVWGGMRGKITKRLIEQKFAAPSHSSFQVWICGPESMYETFCGPRDDAKVTGVLGKMGYSTLQVYKF